MHIILEMSGPFQWRPRFWPSRPVYRVGWLWFAVGFCSWPYDKFINGLVEIAVEHGKREATPCPNA